MSLLPNVREHFYDTTTRSRRGEAIQLRGNPASQLRAISLHWTLMRCNEWIVTVNFHRHVNKIKVCYQIADWLMEVLGTLCDPTKDAEWRIDHYSMEIIDTMCMIIGYNFPGRGDRSKLSSRHSLVQTGVIKREEGGGGWSIFMKLA